MTYIVIRSSPAIGLLDILSYVVSPDTCSNEYLFNNLHRYIYKSEL